ncbi:tetratricopeptide repeat protein [Polynucleobacter necessarius]|uniref:tetratricopeptide repeat protein n=1 Tax=Polynucleobacter necessarius TaxID=576610 RepID=UPI000E0972A7|nr:tetratricopeptide repeat protein [Polynucleobacter necessarius]
MLSGFLWRIPRLFLLRKQYDSALGCCIQALITKPGYQEALSLKGEIYLQVKDYQNALAAYDELLQLNPTSCEAWIFKGHIYSEMKEFSQAKNSFQKAFEIKPDTDFLLGTIIQNDLQICDWGSLDLEMRQLTDGIKDGKRVAIPYNLISLIES